MLPDDVLRQHNLDRSGFLIKSVSAPFGLQVRRLTAAYAAFPPIRTIYKTTYLTG